RDHIAVRALHRFMSASGIRHLSIQKSLKAYTKALDQLIKKEAIDLVVAPDYQDYMRFCIRPLPMPQFDVPLIIVLHGSKTFLSRMAGQRESPVVQSMETAWVRQAQMIIAVSRFVEKASRGYFNWPDSVPTFVIPNGLPLHASPASDRSARDPNQVVFAGTLVEAKGIYPLMRAWNRVVAQRPKARLDVYGKGPIPKIQALIAPKYRNTVRFHGHVDRQTLSEAYTQASIGVFPSFLETFGIAALEAMYAGLAVVYTRLTVGPELIEEGRTGLLADPGDEEELVRQIVYLLDHPDEAASMGQRARQEVMDRYAIDRVAASHVEVYQRLISS